MKPIEIIDAALIILITLVINAVGTILVLKLYLIRLNIQPYIRMAKAYASQMGTKSQQVQHSTRQKQLATEAKRKVADAAIDELPMGGVLKRVIEKAGLSGEEIFSLIQDQDFMKGVQVIIGTFSGAIQKITGKSEEKPSLGQQEGFIGQR